MPDYAALIERLEKLTGPLDGVDAACAANDLAPWWPTESKEWHLFNAALRGSIDAAVALVERVLPGWVFDLIGQEYVTAPNGYKPFGWTVELVNGKRVQGQSALLPVAILIATLRALSEASS